MVIHEAASLFPKPRDIKAQQGQDNVVIFLVVGVDLYIAVYFKKGC